MHVGVPGSIQPVILGEGSCLEEFWSCWDFVELVRIPSCEASRVVYSRTRGLQEFQHDLNENLDLGRKTPKPKPFTTKPVREPCCWGAGFRRASVLSWAESGRGDL